MRLAAFVGGEFGPRSGGYVTGITEEQLRGAPKYPDESSWDWSDPATARSVNAYYGVPVA